MVLEPGLRLPHFGLAVLTSSQVWLFHQEGENPRGFHVEVVGLETRFLSRKIIIKLTFIECLLWATLEVFSMGLSILQTT